jgi:hypothetical protein
MSAHLVASATGKYKATCKLCRKPVAESPALDIPVIGDPGKRVKELQVVLMRHLAKHHTEGFTQGGELLDEVLTFLVFTAFQFEDPSIDPRIEAIRARVFAKVRKNTMEDAMIEHVVAGFGLDPDDALKVNGTMKALRDACCEFGPFAPKVPEISKLVMP